MFSGVVEKLCHICISLTFPSAHSSPSAMRLLLNHKLLLFLCSLTRRPRGCTMQHFYTMLPRLPATSALCLCAHLPTIANSLAYYRIKRVRQHCHLTSLLSALSPHHHHPYNHLPLPASRSFALAAFDARLLLFLKAWKKNSDGRTLPRGFIGGDIVFLGWRRHRQTTARAPAEHGPSRTAARHFACRVLLAWTGRRRAGGTGTQDDMAVLTIAL